MTLEARWVKTKVICYAEGLLASWGRMTNSEYALEKDDVFDVVCIKKINQRLKVIISPKIRR